MRDAFARTLAEMAATNEDIYLIVADISPAGALKDFKEKFPERMINVGVAEQSMIGIAAGLALKGKRPFCYTIATFALYRPFEFIRNDLCYQNLPVVICGMGAGVIYADHGGTHHTMEDIAIASAIPNMQIIAPCDPLETADATKWCCQQKNGPVYLRLGKAGEPNLTEYAQSWHIGKQRRINNSSGGGACIITYGVISKLAVDIAKQIGGTVYSIHTLKPLNTKEIMMTLTLYNHVIVIEEHVPNGGLSSQVKQIAWDTKAKCRLDCFTLKDEFIHCNGKHSDMLEAHGLSLESILKRIQA